MTDKTPSSFQKFESLAKQVFTAPKAKVAKALAKEKSEREKKRKAG